MKRTTELMRNLGRQEVTGGVGAAWTAPSIKSGLTSNLSPFLHHSTSPSLINKLSCTELLCSTTFKMVSITALTTVVVLATAAAAADFKQPCNAPYDVCGWELTNGVYGMFIAPLFSSESVS